MQPAQGQLVRSYGQENLHDIKPVPPQSPDTPDSPEPGNEQFVEQPPQNNDANHDDRKCTVEKVRKVCGCVIL